MPTFQERLSILCAIGFLSSTIAGTIYIRNSQWCLFPAMVSMEHGMMFPMRARRVREIMPMVPTSALLRSRVVRIFKQHGGSALLVKPA